MGLIYAENSDHHVTRRSFVLFLSMLPLLEYLAEHKAPPLDTGSMSDADLCRHAIEELLTSADARPLIVERFIEILETEPEGFANALRMLGWQSRACPARPIRRMGVGRPAGFHQEVVVATHWTVACETARFGSASGTIA
jgi:hypothetical protein